MKKTLLLIIPLLFLFVSCEDKENEEVSTFIGTWNLTFTGEYENADCTGDLDSSNWVLAQAFGVVIMEASMTFDEDGTVEMSFSALGNTETETGTWSENDDGSLSIDGKDGYATLAADGNSFSVTAPSDAYCEDYDGEDLSEYADQGSCEDAGNEWNEATCMYSEYTKQ